MSHSRTKNSAKNAVVNLGARMVTLFSAFVIRTIFLKYLGVQYTGVSTLFTDILHILSFTELGLGTAISFAFYKPVADQDDYRIAQLMLLCKYIYAIISISVLVLGLAFIPFLHFFVKDVPDIKENITFIYVLYVIKTALSYLLIYKSTLLIAKQKQFVVTASESLCSIIKTVAVIVVLMATKNFMLYLGLEIVCTLGTNLLISFFSDKELKKGKVERKVKIEKSDFRGLFKDVKDVFIYKVNGIILSSTDSLIISHAINATAVAYISNYNLIFNSIANIAYQMISAMTASLGNLAVQKTSRDQKDVFDTINFFVYVFSSVVCCGLWLCANPFIEIIWGKEYLLSSNIVLLLCLNFFVVNMHMSVDMFRTANGIFHKGRMRPLTTAIINLVVSIVCAYYWGLFGVLLGTVVSRVTTQVWYDSKLIFNIVFQESVKSYYMKYAQYMFGTIVCCALGSFVVNFLSDNAVLKFTVGFCFALAINIGLFTVFYRKTAEYKRATGYIKMLIKR